MDYQSIGKKAGLEILEVFDLIDYDLEMHKLYNQLSKYSNTVFNPNQRLLFLYYDTDYIISDFYLTLYNLHQVLYKTFIPTYTCVLVSQHDVTKQLIKLSDTVTKDIPVTYVPFEGHLEYYKPPKEKTGINIDALEKQYIFLSNVPRFHRRLLFNWLNKNQILDLGLVSHKSPILNAMSDSSYTEIADKSVQFIYSKPRSRINDSWPCEDESLKEIASIIPLDFKNFQEMNTNLTNANYDLTQRAFCYVSSETVFDYPYPYTSEKSYKAFAAMRPMISFGAAGTLRKLKSFGFKTWNQWWSEEYDEIENTTERFIAVSKLLKEISTISLDQCKIMLNDMKDVLIHNQELYVDNFLSNQTSSLIECLKSNR